MENEPEVEQQQLTLTIQQAAARLSISRAAFYKLLSKKEGPPTIRFGRSVRIRAISLQDWVEKREKEQSGDEE